MQCHWQCQCTVQLYNYRAVLYCTAYSLYSLLPIAYCLPFAKNNIINHHISKIIYHTWLISYMMLISYKIIISYSNIKSNTILWTTYIIYHISYFVTNQISYIVLCELLFSSHNLFSPLFHFLRLGLYGPPAYRFVSHSTSRYLI